MKTKKIKGAELDSFLKKRTNKISICKFNFGCGCTDDERKYCDYCGWNPKVEEARRERIQGRYHFDKIGERLERVYEQFRMGLITREEAHEKFDKVKESLIGTRKSVPQA